MIKLNDTQDIELVETHYTKHMKTKNQLLKHFSQYITDYNKNNKAEFEKIIVQINIKNIDMKNKYIDLCNKKIESSVGGKINMSQFNLFVCKNCSFAKSVGLDDHTKF